MESELPIDGQLEQANIEQEVLTIMVNETMNQNNHDVSPIDDDDDVERDASEGQILWDKPTRMDSNEFMTRYARTPNDTNDPSYTQLTLPYSVFCRERYHNAQAKQRAQFVQEIKVHELLRAKALDGVRIHREFCNPIIRRVSPKERIKLTKKQQERLNRLLEDV